MQFGLSACSRATRAENDRHEPVRPAPKRKVTRARPPPTRSVTPHADFGPEAAKEAQFIRGSFDWFLKRRGHPKRRWPLYLPAIFSSGREGLFPLD